jgi:hypothetical protein
MFDGGEVDHLLARYCGASLEALRSWRRNEFLISLRVSVLKKRAENGHVVM